jgi:hypothetical protein
MELSIVGLVSTPLLLFSSFLFFLLLFPSLHIHAYISSPIILYPQYHLPNTNPPPSETELKELIAMHSSLATHGGDLKTDTVTIIGATLDLQEKVVKQVFGPSFRASFLSPYSLPFPFPSPYPTHLLV